jgi:acetyltransferase-like isoleucine patch superfamily enzyme
MSPGRAGVEMKTIRLRARLSLEISNVSKRFGGPELDKSLRLFDLVELIGSLGCKLARGMWWSQLCGGRGLLLVGRYVTVRNPGHITQDGVLILEDFAEVQGLSSRGIQFGSGVVVGRYASIRPSGYYGREIGEGMIIGSQSNIGPYCFIGCGGFVTIGSRVMMGQGVRILAEQHEFADTSLAMREQGVARRGIVIGDDCWLGSGSTVLDGVRLETGTVVAAGAVVTKSFPARSVIAGVPAKLLRIRS